MRTALAISLLAAACSVLVSTPQASAGPHRAVGCAGEYGYAGVMGAKPATGVRAHVTALSSPVVRWGHVAAWVGMSSGSGPAGTWIQAGIAGFEGGENTLYYEVARTGSAPVYTAVRYGVATAEGHDLAVREVPGAAGSWRVWVDGAPVSPPIALPGSHGAWRPTAMAESWNGGTGACNAFHFSFGDLRSTRHAGGPWQPLRSAPRLVDRGYRLVGDASRLLASTT